MKKSFRPHAAARPLWWRRYSRDGGRDEHELPRLTMRDLKVRREGGSLFL